MVADFFFVLCAFREDLKQQTLFSNLLVTEILKISR
jgi:hypothetical protein